PPPSSTPFPYTTLFRSVPVRAFGEVGGRELPLLARLPEPLEEPLPLLVPGQVEEELEHDRAIARQVALECVDIRVAVGPEVAVRSEEHTSELQSLRHLV